MPTSLTLRPCPFCGSRDAFISNVSADEHHAFFAVACAKCEADGPIERTESGAALAWNARPEPKPDGHE